MKVANAKDRRFPENRQRSTGLEQYQSNTCWAIAQLWTDHQLPPLTAKPRVPLHKDGVWQTWLLQITEPKLAVSERPCFLLPGCFQIKSDQVKLGQGIWVKGEKAEGFNPTTLSISVRRDHKFLKYSEYCLGARSSSTKGMVSNTK